MFAGQLAIGWQNDWTDADRDRATGRTDKPIANGQVTRRVVGLAALIAGAACIPASMRNGRSAGTIHLAAVASAATYNAGLKATPASFIPYAVSFSLLPVFVHRSCPGESKPPLWAPLAAGSLGVAAHVLNVLPDRDLDRSVGILGLPQRLSHGQNLAIVECLLLASSTLVSFGPKQRGLRPVAGYVASLGLASAAIQAARARDDRRAFRRVLLLSLLNVTQLMAGARRYRSSD